MSMGTRKVSFPSTATSGESLSSSFLPKTVGSKLCFSNKNNYGLTKHCKSWSGLAIDRHRICDGDYYSAPSSCRKILFVMVNLLSRQTRCSSPPKKRAFTMQILTLTVSHIFSGVLPYVASVLQWVRRSIKQADHVWQDKLAYNDWTKHCYGSRKITSSLASWFA